MKRIVSITVVNEHSVLARISGLFAGRGYNIESLTVAPLPNDNLSKISISTRGDEKVLEQIIKQLHKLIPVLNVSELTELIDYELLLVKFDVNERLTTIITIMNSLKANLVSSNEKNIIFSISNESFKINETIKFLQNYSPKEIIRSGVVAIER